jgi:anti-sigma regulatory factor (Ser/Thr protein kinase)
VARTDVLGCEAASVAAARRSVAAELRHEPPEVAHAAVLMASELVANVVRHAETEVTLVVDAGPPVRVEVHDGVAATDAFREAMAAEPAPVEPHATGGRGLWIVKTLASRIGLRDLPDGGKAVWFELDP